MGAGPASACPPRDSASGSIQEGAMQSKNDSQAQQISSTPHAERFADAGPDPEQAYRGKELTELLEEDLAGLSPLLRSAYLLREVEGLTTGEAARELGVTQNTLKARLWRARQQLASRLGRRLRRDDSATASSAAATQRALGAMGYAYSTD